MHSSQLTIGMWTVSFTSSLLFCLCIVLVFSVQSTISANTFLRKHRFQTSCKDFMCRPGRVCVQTSPSLPATCECAPDNYCSEKKSPVCGSDNVLYPSHCELHREACLQKTPIHPMSDVSSCLDHRTTTETTTTTTSSILNTQLKKHLPSTKTTLLFETTTENIAESGYNADNGEIREKISLSFKCNEHEKSLLRKRLIDYQCFQLGFAHCNEDMATGSHKLLGFIFGFLDRDGDKLITLDDLEDTQEETKIIPPESPCKLLDLLPQANKDGVDKMLLGKLLGFEKLAKPENKFVTVHTGMRLILQCDLQPFGTRWRWLKNGFEMFEQDQLHSVRKQESDTRTFLTLHNVNQADSGVYTCINPDNSYSQQKISVSVISEPAVSVLPHTIVKEEGKSITFYCYSPTSYQVEYEWRFDTEPVNNLLSKYNFTVSGDGRRLTVGRTLRQHTGIYSCRVSNSAGRAEAAGSLYIRKSTESDLDSYPLTSNYLNPEVLLFHGGGYTLYSQEVCGPTISVSVDEDERLCEGLFSCLWGPVQKAGYLIFASQPSLGRILVINSQSWYQFRVLRVQCPVVKMSYDQNRDKLWLACSNKRIFTLEHASQTHNKQQAVLWLKDEFDCVLALPDSSADYVVVSQEMVTHDTRVTDKRNYKYQLISLLDQSGNKMSMFKTSSLVLLDTATYIPQGGLMLIYSSGNKSSSVYSYDVKLKKELTKETHFQELGRLFVSPNRKLILFLVNTNVYVYEVQSNGELKLYLKDVAGVEIHNLVFTQTADGHDKILAETSRNGTILVINLFEKSFELVFDKLLETKHVVTSPEFGDSAVMTSSIASVFFNTLHLQMSPCAEMFLLELQKVFWLSS